MLRVVAGVRRWLLARLWVGQPLEMLTGSLMVVAMASGAVGHPGDTWTQESVPGGVLTLGVGVEGADPQHPDAVIAVPRSVWEHAGVSPEMLQGWWPVLRERHERLGGLCAERFLASPGHERALRGTGGHDVLTLLGSASLRAALAGSDGVGLVGVAVPTRAHGFLMNRMVDPAFLAVLTAAASAADVGVAGPVLVTRDEVVRVVQRRVALVSSALENALVVDVRQVGVVSFFA